jgi:hypothetical protein
MYLKISRQRLIKLAANQIRYIYNLSDALAIHLAMIHVFDMLSRLQILFDAAIVWDSY